MDTAEAIPAVALELRLLLGRSCSAGSSLLNVVCGDVVCEVVCTDEVVNNVIARSVELARVEEDVCVGTYMMNGFVESMSVSACMPRKLHADSTAPTKPMIIQFCLRSCGDDINSLDCAFVAHEAVMHGRSYSPSITCTTFTSPHMQ